MVNCKKNLRMYRIGLMIALAIVVSFLLVTSKPVLGDTVRTEADLNVIPDKYNTGCTGGLTKVTGACEINGLEFRLSGTNIVLDFYYANKNASGQYIFENLDFSDYGFVFNSENKFNGKKVNITFRNCRFYTITTQRAASEIFSYKYENCTIAKFSGSNSSFSRCFFGNTYWDCIVPFYNIFVYDCYFCNLASNDINGNGKHSDGTQMYGYTDAKVENVHFKRCRFEIPAVQTTQSTAAVNSCVAVALEYNDASDISIEDCILNGGGYTIYACKKYDYLNLKDVNFNNIKIGAAKLFGSIYPNIAENITMNNITDQNALYVSSVWKDGSGIHVIVSNDTAKERILKIVADGVTYKYKIKACPGGSDLRYSNYDLPFSEFPFDIDITLDSKASSIICYDATGGKNKQIRYVDISSLTSYASSKKANSFLKEGSCGENLSWQLTANGELIISGYGAMKNYHSQNVAPWMEYADYINSICINDGITEIGSQAFRKLINVEHVDIPKSVTKIGANAFISCKKLKTVSFFSDVKEIQNYAFSGTALELCTFHGTQKEAGRLQIGDNNDPLIKCKWVFVK